MPNTAGALLKTIYAHDPIVAPALDIDPSVEAFACGRAALVLKRDGATAHIYGRAAAGLIDALDHGGDTRWQERIADQTANTLAVKLSALGFLHPSVVGQPAMAMLSARLGERQMEAPHLVETHSFFRPDLAHVTEANDEHARRVLRIGAARTWISPVVGVRGSVCWSCFVRRLAAQDDIWSLAQRGVLRALARFGEPAVIDARIADILAEALLARCDDDRLTIVDHETGRCRLHTIRPLPNCRCASGRSIGTSESDHPADLLDRVRAAAGHVIDEVTGAISDAYALDRLPDNPVHVAVARFADPSGMLGGFVADDLGLRSSGLPSRSAFGAATTARDAAAKAMLEALERYCAIVQGDEPIVHASTAALGDAAVDLDDGAQGAARTVTRAWLPARRLAGGIRYVPASAVLAGWGSGRAERAYSSNGMAIAFDRDDAVVRGFLELVERDATAIWWYNRIARPMLDLASFADAFVDRFAANLASQGWSVTVFDLTGDLGVPVLAAMATHAVHAAPIFGFAARFDLRDALTAALCELGQALRFADQEQAKWGAFDWASQPHLTLGTTRRRLGDIEPSQPAGIAACVAIARRASLDILVCDLDRADVGLPVCKVIVPPLLPPGRPAVCARLLETPVRLGWRPRVCASDELNPQILPM